MSATSASRSRGAVRKRFQDYFAVFFRCAEFTCILEDILQLLRDLVGADSVFPGAASTFCLRMASVTSCGDMPYAASRFGFSHTRIA